MNGRLITKANISNKARRDFRLNYSAQTNSSSALELDGTEATSLCSAVFILHTVWFDFTKLHYIYNYICSNFACIKWTTQNQRRTASPSSASRLPKYEIQKVYLPYCYCHLLAVYDYRHLSHFQSHYSNHYFRFHHYMNSYEDYSDFFHYFNSRSAKKEVVYLNVMLTG